MKHLTVVCPLLNEEAGVHAFYERTVAALNRLRDIISYQILFVDDGSTDSTPHILHELSTSDPQVCVLTLSRNFGHQIAITAGIDCAQGDAVVIIDSDLQDPPEVIAEMVSLWQSGYHVVYGQRNLRRGENYFKRATASLFYRTLNRLSDLELPRDVGDFRLIDRKVINALKEIREENRYMRGLVTWVGFRQCPVQYDRDARHAGTTKYPLRKMLKFATDGIVSFSEKPMRLAIQLGVVVTIVSVLWALYILIGKILDPNTALPGYASMMVVMLFLGGAQLLTIGILGQYLGRTYAETKRRPLYVIADSVNLDVGNITSHGYSAQSALSRSGASLQSSMSESWRHATGAKATADPKRLSEDLRT